MSLNGKAKTLGQPTSSAWPVPISNAIPLLPLIHHSCWESHTSQAQWKALALVLPPWDLFLPGLAPLSSGLRSNVALWMRPSMYTLYKTASSLSLLYFYLCVLSNDFSGTVNHSLIYLCPICLSLPAIISASRWLRIVLLCAVIHHWHSEELTHSRHSINI